ncbi:hypothetical protein TanjilG_05814 [Lupinus angustifolius]|uniref:Myb-like domain-containing protein n=1 Tax=Lupinus angustifolius TaxID=3871 RepID=A0A4P1R3Q0_LUPAN|nr:PREDICTED: dnaJ homolog subfamily C member 2 [Lupinus angustifolius]OIW00464.1 hypothetical protein TanjilG_05814 [Lupinus angustifolius]
MEFLDEDAKPRFVFQAGAPKGTITDPQLPYNKPTKPLLFVTVSLSSLLFALSIFFFQSEPFKSLFFWFSISLLVGPFAPTSLTAGDIRVGQGPIVEFPEQETATTDDDSRKRGSNRRSKVQTRRSDEFPVPAVVPVAAVTANGKGNSVAAAAVVEEEKEWREEDVAILKKQLLKNPVGKPRRWEVIAEAFGGRHKAESVIKKAKELSEKKVDDSDSYAEFLKNRKVTDKRVENNAVGDGEDVKGGSEWSSGEDIALLNALKAFPKEAPMRWEKIAAAVPAKSKAACVKRVAELTKGFRTAKATVDG